MGAQLSLRLVPFLMIKRKKTKQTKGGFVCVCEWGNKRGLCWTLCLHPHGGALEDATCCTFVGRLNLAFLCPL